MIKVTPDFVADQMRKNKLPFWNVYEGSKIIDTSGTEALDIETSIENLRSTLRCCAGGTVNITLSDRSNADKAKGGRDYEKRQYTVQLEGGAINGPAAGSSGLYGDIMRLEVAAIKREYEHREELRKLKEETQEPAGFFGIPAPVMEQVLPVLAGVVMEKLGIKMPAAAASAALAGIDEQQVQPLLTRWQSIDPNYSEVISALVSFAAREPETYNSYRSMLLNLNKG